MQDKYYYINWKKKQRDREWKSTHKALIEINFQFYRSEQLKLQYGNCLLFWFLITLITAHFNNITRNGRHKWRRWWWWWRRRRRRRHTFIWTYISYFQKNVSSLSSQFIWIIMYWKWMKWETNNNTNNSSKKKQQMKSKSQRTIIFMKTPTDWMQIVQLELGFHCTDRTVCVYTYRRLCKSVHMSIGLLLCVCVWIHSSLLLRCAVKLGRRCVDCSGSVFVFSSEKYSGFNIISFPFQVFGFSYFCFLRAPSNSTG